MILVLGSVVTQVGRSAEALALSQEHVTRSRAEPGCISDAVHQDTQHPQRLVFVEQWLSKARCRALRVGSGCARRHAHGEC